MKFSYFSFFILTALNFRGMVAQECTAANAESLDNYVNSSPDSGSGGGAIVGAPAGFDPVGQICGACLIGRGLSSLEKRNTLSCSSEEKCLSYEGVPFCFNLVTFDFQAADGTTGNFKTGAYVLPDGQQGNLYTGPYPSNTGAAAAASTAAAATNYYTSASSAPASSVSEQTLAASTPQSVTVMSTSPTITSSEAQTSSLSQSQIPGKSAELSTSQAPHTTSNGVPSSTTPTATVTESILVKSEAISLSMHMGLTKIASLLIGLVGFIVII